MALWSQKTVQVPGLASVYASSGPITAQNRYHYILDTTSNTITVNLPTGIDGATIRITDAKEKFLTNNVTVNPASGQKINNLATNESLILDANGMWVELTWNASAGTWIVNAPTIVQYITSNYTDYPYITSPSSPASSTLRLYAKSDGKLYIKNPAGVESKVGGGLEHPTTGSTFEVDSFNLSMTGTGNTGLGVGAVDSLTSGTENVGIGISAATALTTGAYNVAIGAFSMYQITTGIRNVAIGYNTLGQSTSSNSFNTAVGSSALSSLFTGSYNVAIGAGSASNFSNGSYNTFINGSGFSTSTTASGVVVIGQDSSGNISLASASNQFVLGTSNHLYRFPGVAQTSLVLGPTGTSTGNTGELRFRELAANGVNSVGLRAADSITDNVTWTLPSADGTTGQALVTNGSGTLSWAAAAGNTVISVAQASHGFTSQDAGRPVYLNGSNYVFAKADLQSTAEVAGVIESIIDNNNFNICLAGEIEIYGQSPYLTDNIQPLAAYLANYTSEYKNPNFYEYTLDGTDKYIADGTGDMYDGGNYTYPWFLNGVSRAGQSAFLSEALSYANTISTIVDTDFKYASLGYVQAGSTRPLMILGTRTTVGNPVGFQKSGDTGADGVGSIIDGFVYSNQTIGTSTVYAYYRQIYGTSDPSICDVYILLGNSVWGSVFGSTITSYSDATTTNSNGGYLYVSGANTKDILAITLLLSKPSGALITTAEIQNSVTAIVNRINTYTSGSGSQSNAIEDGSPVLTPGEVYFLSSTTAGKITTTPPSVVGQISKPLGIARTTAALDFFNMRGSAIGGSNVYTQISLANNTTTTIQNASAYNSVELAGWMYINATAKYRFHFKAQVTKKGDATDYLISYQTSGDTPPTGFNISVTTGGLVQVTLPSVSGFTSAIAQFALNGPAVGASLPLSIDSSNVSFGTVQAKDSNGIIVNNSSGVQLTKFTDRVREHIYHYSSATNLSNQYIHLKTNIAMTDRMPLFKFAGYAYGEQKPIDTNLVLYAYSVSNSIINVGTYGSHTCSTYKSTDGYVVLTILLPNMYFVGFSVSVYQLTPSPVQTDITISAATNSSSSTGVY